SRRPIDPAMMLSVLPEGAVGEEFRCSDQARGQEPAAEAADPFVCFPFLSDRSCFGSPAVWQIPKAGNCSNKLSRPPHSGSCSLGSRSIPAFPTPLRRVLVIIGPGIGLPGPIAFLGGWLSDNGLPQSLGRRWARSGGLFVDQ